MPAPPPPDTSDDPSARSASAARARARRLAAGAAPRPARTPAPTPDVVEQDVPETVQHDAAEQDAAEQDAAEQDPAEQEAAEHDAAEQDDGETGDEAAAPTGSRAGRNLPMAIGVGVGLGAVILISLFAYRPSFPVIVGIAALYGCWELSRALRAASIRIVLMPLLVGSVALLAAAWHRGPNGLVLAALVTLLGLVVWRIGDGAHGFTRDVAASAFVLLYVPTLAGFAVLLAHPDDGAARVLAFVGTVVCSDTGGYAAGVLFGRHPLAPVVSKGKTWEGFAGSLIACSAAGVLILTLTFHQTWWEGLLFGLAIVVTATVGDLGESMIKRDVGLKDMGSLLPGHGGLMDRLDSLLPCAAVAYLLLSAFAPV